MADEYDEQDDLELEPEEDEGGTGEPDPAAEIERQVAERVKQAENAAKANAGRELAELRRELETLRAQQQAPPPPPATEADEDYPDPTLYPEEFKAWQGRRETKLRKEIMQEVSQQLGVFAQPVLGGQIGAALAQVDDVLPKARLGFLLEIPTFRDDFAKQLRESGIAPELWTQPKTIRAVAGVVAAQYDEFPEETPADPAAVERARRAGAAGLQRALAAGVGSTRGGGPSQAPSEPSDEEREGARFLGVSVAEYRGLGDANATGYRREQLRKREKAGAR